MRPEGPDGKQDNSGYGTKEEKPALGVGTGSACLVNPYLISSFLARALENRSPAKLMSAEVDLKQRRRTLVLLVGITLAMFGFGFALVPIYGLLCDLTGIPSIEQRVNAKASIQSVHKEIEERWITVKFDATVQPDLPWFFEPMENKLKVRLGEIQDMKFKVENRSSDRVSGQAIPNIAPWQATPFFDKIECFCFRQQTLTGGESKEMPLRFVVSQDLPEGIEVLTLSYIFMKQKENTDKDKLAAK